MVNQKGSPGTVTTFIAIVFGNRWLRSNNTDKIRNEENAQARRASVPATLLLFLSSVKRLSDECVANGHRQLKRQAPDDDAAVAGRHRSSPTHLKI